MNFLKNFTIRRVVLWILLTAMGLITVTGGYAAFVVHDMHRYFDQSFALTHQVIFLAHAEDVLHNGTAAQKVALQNEVPSGFEWASYKQHLSDSSLSSENASGSHLSLLTKQIDAAQLQVADELHQLNAVLFLAVSFTILLVIFCDRYLVVHLVRPVSLIRGHFHDIGKGDLTREPIEQGRNCIGQMVPLLREMQQSLQKTVRAITVNSNALYKEASEIAEGNTDLANRTTQQAAALEETAVSMEEFSSTVRHNADNACQARNLALITATVTDKASVLVERLTVTMSRISEEAEQIRRFTSTINSIAFQTNILALNAAVEAARAGEQGRGFAVVATEVRSLAQRSASAAQEIETLISTTFEFVREGAEVAGGAGSAMSEVKENVNSVNELIGLIALSSNEQSKGISQVTLSVAELDRVTQQNAALVKKVTLSAGNLHARTEKLREVVSSFVLPTSNSNIK
ncbi:methyl-accepting chemotaxis protein [Rahnella sikkimica]|uniref:Transcription factor n=1 Tax=Rahnella sikkimica TaxID=1805933 RepID=A0A2L1UYK0_9GAMM|nr:methyl-accepting chemotaxis protein [Rahnella sikkimica]AVF38005.1 transcription factor [Rahnella sikkimica]